MPKLGTVKCGWEKMHFVGWWWWEGTQFHAVYDVLCSRFVTTLVNDACAAKVLPNIFRKFVLTFLCFHFFPPFCIFFVDVSLYVAFFVPRFILALSKHGRISRNAKTLSRLGNSGKKTPKNTFTSFVHNLHALTLTHLNQFRMAPSAGKKHAKNQHNTTTHKKRTIETIKRQNKNKENKRTRIAGWGSRWANQTKKTLPDFNSRKNISIKRQKTRKKHTKRRTNNDSKRDFLSICRERAGKRPIETQ